MIQLAGLALPTSKAPRTRTALLRAAGLDVHRTAVFRDLPTILKPQWGGGTLHIGERAFVNIECVLDLSDDVIIDSHVYIAHRVMLITSSHEIGDQWQRASGSVTHPISIGRGAWLGAGCTILPGVKVGDGSIVGAGSVINRDVPANTLVAGVPAQVVRTLP